MRHKERDFCCGKPAGQDVDHFSRCSFPPEDWEKGVSSVCPRIPRKSRGMVGQPQIGNPLRETLSQASRRAVSCKVTRGCGVMPIKSADEFKYYLYISAAKLRMLYEQATRDSSRNRTFEWGINLKIASVKSTSAREDKVDRDAMLKRVLEGLVANDQLGTLAAPKSFIRDTFPIRWGFYNDCDSRPADEPALVYFGGFKNNLLLGMGGSSCYVVGHEGATSTWSRSSTPTLARWLLSGVQKGKRPPTWDDPRSEESEVFRAMAVAQYYLRPPTQTVEFVAKTIAFGEVQGMKPFIGIDKARAILATPLYVAQTDLIQIDRFRATPVWGLTERDWISKEAKKARGLLSPSREETSKVDDPRRKKY